MIVSFQTPRVYFISVTTLSKDKSRQANWHFFGKQVASGLAARCIIPARNSPGIPSDQRRMIAWEFWQQAQATSESFRAERTSKQRGTAVSKPAPTCR